MKHFSPVPLLAALVAAATISACSAGTAPTATPRSSARADGSANHSHDPVDAGSFTTVDFPGATATVLFAINNEGVAVGRYASAGRTHGLVRSATGELTTIDFPGAGFTVAGALNNRGDIVGRFCTRTVCREPGSGDFHGFLLRDGEFTILDIPESNETNAWEINDRGEILGGFGVTGRGAELFLLRKGELTTFALPNGKVLSEDNGGLNAHGDIVGKYCDASPCLIGPTGAHGLAISGGRLTTIDVPGALGTGAFGINAGREVVGGYYDAGGALHGYVMRLETGAGPHAGE
jgi:uncharacterized membrane protein